jgi:hypothetical protein
MLRSYLLGAGAATRRWPLIVTLWMIGAVFGTGFALASGTWLTEALDGSLATRTLARAIDANVLVDLWYHHAEGLHMLLVLAIVLAVIHTVLWWWLHGVIVVSLQHDAAERGGELGQSRGVWTGGLALAPVMAQLFAIALIVLSLFSAAVGGPAYLLVRWTRSEPAAYIWYEIGGAALAMWLLGWVFLVAVHDHARLRAGRTGESAFAAYRWAFAFVLHGGERAFLLACALQLTGLALWLAYHAVAVGVPMSAILGLTGSLLWGEAFLLLRVWVRVWFFAAQNELQS